MSDWMRSGREDDPGRNRFEDRDRREFGGQDRWRRSEQRGERGEGQRWQYQRGQEQRWQEDRSFEDRRAGGFGRADQDRERRERMWGREGEEQRDWGFGEGYRERYGQRGDKDYRGDVARAQGGYGQYGEQGRQFQGGQEQRYGEGGGMMGGNPPLERVASGEADRGWRANMGMGEGRHRGRGPKNYVRSDDRIREDVNDRLSDDSWLDASEIEVQVSKCEVTLSGTVQSREDRRRAEDLVEQVSGVKHVQNNLRVQPTQGQAGSGFGQSGTGQTGTGQTGQSGTGQAGQGTTR